MADLIVDTYKLNQYAQRISRVNARIDKIDSRLNKLYFRVGLLGLWQLLQADALTCYSKRLVQCQNYLEQTASDLESVEQVLENTDALNFDPFFNRISSEWQHLFFNKAIPINVNLSSMTQKQISEIFNELIAAVANEVDGWGDDIDTAGSALAWIEKLYDKIPREPQAALNIFLALFMPESMESAYKLTSGILQRNLTGEDIYDVATSICGQSLSASVVVEAFNYALTKGGKLSNEMEKSVIEQLKELDILGAGMEVTEGIIDGLVGGSIECLCKAGGSYIDHKIDSIPIAGKIITEGTKYLTGKLTGGEEYTLGDLVGIVGEKTSGFIDGVTDAYTDFTDVATSGLTKGVKGVCSWVGSWFE